MVRRLGIGRITGVWVLLLALGLVLAGSATAAALSQGYHATTALDSGSVVSLDPTTAGAVLAANNDRLTQLLGVVVASNESVLSVSDSGSNVQVVTSGQVATLVSNLNGDIAKGDAVTASPINGVAMKAAASGRILGYASAAFSASSAGAVAKTVTGQAGHQQSISVGTIPVQVGVTTLAPATTHSAVPAALQNVADNFAGRSVSTVRIVLAGLILIFSLIVIVILVNSAAASSINSLGRNPLARRAVSGGLIKVLLLAVAILLVALGSVYFIIKG